MKLKIKTERINMKIKHGKLKIKTDKLNMEN